MAQQGDIVTVDFPGVMGVKRRPALVISSHFYHETRPDVILGLITSQVTNAIQPTDYLLRDWAQAGLHRPSAFRSFLVTMPMKTTLTIGHLSENDWQEVQNCLQQALAF